MFAKQSIGSWNELFGLKLLVLLGFILYSAYFFVFEAKHIDFNRLKSISENEHR